MPPSSARCCSCCTISAWWSRTACAAMRGRPCGDVTLLDPNWLTGAIYTLLNSPTVRDQGGELARAQLGGCSTRSCIRKHGTSSSST